MTTIGNYTLTAKPVETAHKPIAAMDKWFCEAGGAYDFMNTMKKAATLAGDDVLAKKLLGYVAGTAVPRLPASAYAFSKNIDRAKTEGLTARNVFALCHGALDTSALASFTSAFFTKGDSMPILNAGITLSAMADTAEIGVHSAELIQAKAWKEDARTQNSADLQQALSAKISFLALKLFKNLTASLAGFVTCYHLFTGVALMSMVAATWISFASSLANIGAFYTKNLSPFSLDAKFIDSKVVHAKIA